MAYGTLCDIHSVGRKALEARSKKLEARRIGRAWPLLLLLLVGLGCPPPVKPEPIPEPVSLEESLAAVNANIAAVGAFKADISEWWADFPDPQKDALRHHHELGGKWFYEPNPRGLPANMYLQCNGPFKAGLVVGSNARDYWFFSEWGESGGWGKYEHVGKPCSEVAQFDPRVVLEFVGLTPLPFYPRPIYKVGPQTYTIEYLFYDNQDGVELLGPNTQKNVTLRREIIIDRRTQLPIEVNAYNGAGLRMMHSELKDYTTVGKETQQNGGPLAQLPRDILLRWDQQDAQLRFKLSSIKPDIKPDRKKRDLLFTRPERVPDLKHYEQIDKACDEAENAAPITN